MGSEMCIRDRPRIIKSGNRIAKFTYPPEIVFQNVSFKYPNTERYVLKNFSYTFKPALKYAIVGNNGAGKSTLIKLLFRFYDVSEGNILINGIDIKEYELESWYQNLGILFQNFVKFEYLNVKDNVLLGDIEADVSEENVYNSLVKADAEEFVSKLPKGLHQILKKSVEGGIDLSGGQWQKLALARSFYRDSPILILDEPTSAIDAVAEAEIFERLFDYISNKTVLIVSHRFSTVRRADQILVINEGELVESGTHEELLQLGKLYANSFKIQAEGYK